MIEKKYNLKNDIIFKAFFARKGKEEYLREFLEALLEIRIVSIEVKEEVNLEKLLPMQKGGSLDLQAKLNTGTIVNIEMQRKDLGNIQIRTVFYAAKIISREVVAGTDYEDIEKTVLVNILNYTMFDEYEDYISKTAIVLDKHRECVVSDTVEWWYIELPKFRKQRPDMNKTINQWLAFIDDEDEELVKMAENKNKTLKKARTDMNYLTGDEEVKRLAELREKWDMEYSMSMKYAKKIGEEEGKKAGIKEGKKAGIEEGKKAGIEEGKKAGIEEGKKAGIKKGKREANIENAKKMLELDIPIEKIEKITGLTKEELEEIKNK